MKQSKWISVLPGGLFFAVLFFFLISTLIAPKETISSEERRRLQKQPELSLTALMSQKYQDQSELYLQDHLFGRPGLLRLRSAVNLNLLGRLDDEGLTEQDGILISTGEEFNRESIDHAAAVFDRIWTSCLKDSKCKVYFSIVPDKAYFLKDRSDRLTMDYDAFFEAAASLLPAASQIDLASSLSLSDYYASDPHWKQEKLSKQAALLAEAMNVEPVEDWTEKNAGSFAGAQGAISALHRQEDSLGYLKIPSMKDWIVTRYDQNGENPGRIYDFSKIDSLDPYEFYSGGAAGMITYENPEAKTDRELIVFTDSFGWSMTPLLAASYAKTTLIDLRNLPSWRISSVIDFTDQDVLFLYSSSVLNQSDALR